MTTKVRIAGFRQDSRDYWRDHEHGRDALFNSIHLPLMLSNCGNCVRGGMLSRRDGGVVQTNMPWR